MKLPARKDNPPARRGKDKLLVRKDRAIVRKDKVIVHKGRVVLVHRDKVAGIRPEDKADDQEEDRKIIDLVVTDVAAVFRPGARYVPFAQIKKRK